MMLALQVTAISIRNYYGGIKASRIGAKDGGEGNVLSILHTVKQSQPFSRP